jgi:hypothetical protein
MVDRTPVHGERVPRAVSAAGGGASVSGHVRKLSGGNAWLANVAWLRGDTVMRCIPVHPAGSCAAARGV